jgi:hypothetical protein
MDVLSGEAKNNIKHDFNLAEIASKWRESGGSQDACQPQLNRKEDESYETGLIFFEEEWEKVDINKDNVLSIAELQQVLSACAGLKVNSDATREIMDQIKQGAESVSRAEFAAFITERADKLLNDVVEEHTPDLDAHSGNAKASRNSGGSEAFTLALAVPHQPEGIGTKFQGAGAFPGLGRRVPGALRQYRIILHRRMVQWWGHTRRRLIDVCLIVLCAGLMAFNARRNTSSLLSATVYMNLGLFLLVTVSGLRVFADRPVFWRESGRGVSVFAFFYGRYSAEVIDVFIQTTGYVVVYYLILQPEASFEVYFVPCLFGAWVASGWSYVIACLIGPANAAVAAGVFTLSLSGLLPQPSVLIDAVGKGDMMDMVVALSPTRWAMQMINLGYYEEVGGPYEPQPDCTLANPETEAFDYMSDVGIYRMELDLKSAFESSAIAKSMGPQGSGVFALTVQALLLNVIGFLCLKYKDRSKQV